MYSTYINNIQLREEPREPIVGGVPIQLFQNTAKNGTVGEAGTVGGGGESIRKIAHLSIPLGLVLSIPTKFAIYKTHDPEKSDSIIDDTLFHKLYNQTAYQTKSKGVSAATTRKRRR